MLYDDLLFDCEIADSGLMPRTFWVPAEETFEPRCTLEQFARDTFTRYTEGVSFDPEKSGAEWWVQLRPSPEKAGRYAMHGDNEAGICFHWDKDSNRCRAKAASSQRRLSFSLQSVRSAMSTES